jgi:class 3 adenylate cyclase
MGPIIRKHDGFVDKYIGDAVMALYPRCADDAVQCALDMKQALEVYNQEGKKIGRPIINAGIGINTGSVMLGIVGESYRMNATVISDTVNIAARVEALTREHNLDILITEETYRGLKNPARYHISLIGENITVKGKMEPITVYKVQDL